MERGREGYIASVRHILHFTINKWTLFAHRPRLLFWPRVFSRSTGCGARSGGACTPRFKSGSRPGSVARAQCAQSREIWQVTEGRVPAQLEPSRSMETPNCHFSDTVTTLLLAAFFKYRSSPRRRGSHVTATVALQSFSFVTATNGAVSCVYV